ncbi:hypothetical protein [Mesorhizobium sp.]|uniref:hypothetical protein n=1 Tax=Mesorhizobium sp. TaxID=1871066 RepID=UPI000FE61B99|nr:hypothetical protein [Mesorhizobium sp.]RWP54346.1 MAG: hypothetical protein EOR06_10790 [Mesorhizobium sp.]
MTSVWPTIHTSEGPPPVGVMLSVPLAPDLHVLNGAPVFDTSRSWSTSSAIHLRKTAAGYSVAVDVYNLGLTEGLVFVDLVLWYMAPNGARRSITINHASNLPISRASAGGIASMITTPESEIVVPTSQLLTHVYAVAYDPFFDKPDQWSSALLGASVPDFQTNAARQSRHVGCLNVFYAVSGYAFTLTWDFKYDIKHLNPTVTNDTGAPPDICVIKAQGVVDRIALGLEWYVELFPDVRAAAGRITSLIEEHTYPKLLCQHPHCDPNCTTRPDEYIAVSYEFTRDKGVEIDGNHEGNGLIIDVPDISVKTPWSPRSAQTVSLRLLLR